MTFFQPNARIVGGQKAVSKKKIVICLNQNNSHNLSTKIPYSWPSAVLIVFNYKGDVVLPSGDLPFLMSHYFQFALNNRSILN